MEAPEVHQEVIRLRRQFADAIDGLGEESWNAPSWCEGWRVRDVLAHLVRSAESSLSSLTLDIVRGGFRPDRSVSNAARRLADVPVPQLAERLRAAKGGARVPGIPAAMGLADVIVHSADAFRPLGLDVEAPPADVQAALDALCARGRMIVHAAPHADRRLVATDFDWSKGSGPEVQGSGVDLLLLVANRPQVLPRLAGPGVIGLWAK